MKKTIQAMRKKHANALFTITVGLGILVIVLLGLILNNQRKIVVQQSELIRQEQQVVRAFDMEYKTTEGSVRAEKRTDDASKKFMAFLQDQADKSQCGDAKTDLAPAHFVAKAFNDDETQAVIGYGCGSSSALAYAQLKDGSWELLQESNMTEPVTGLPKCSFVNQHTIDRKLAPVCVMNVDSKNDTPPSFVVR